MSGLYLFMVWGLPSWVMDEIDVHLGLRVHGYVYAPQTGSCRAQPAWRPCRWTMSSMKSVRCNLQAAQNTTCNRCNEAQLADQRWHYMQQVQWGPAGWPDCSTAALSFSIVSCQILCKTQQDLTGKTLHWSWCQNDFGLFRLFVSKFKLKTSRSFANTQACKWFLGTDAA